MDPLLKAKNFLENNRLASLATVSGFFGSPHAAIVYYIYDNGSLYFVTEKSSKKAKNIIKNKKVALVIVQENQLETMQIEGRGEAIIDQEQNLQVVQEIYDKLRRNNARDFWPVIQLHPKTLQAFKVEVEWFKYSHFGKELIILEGSPNDWVEHFKPKEQEMLPQSHHSVHSHSHTHGREDA